MAVRLESPLRLRFPAGVVDTTDRTIQSLTEPRPLREKEAHLLDFLACRPNETVSRQTLLVEVFGYAAHSRTGTLATTVRRLRAALKAVGGDASIQSVYGEGYRFVPPVSGPTERLLGRDTELSRLRQLLSEGRFVSVVAWGGVGKTTLARAYLTMEPGVFCSLDGLSTTDGVCSAVASVLELAPSSSAHAVGLTLAGRGNTLLVLDEAERVAEAVRMLVGDWLQAAPGLRVLVTSRRRLGHPREVLLPLGPLEQDAAAALMQRRADALGQRVAPDAALRTVALLDNHPLSIELAAGRLLVLSPEELETRLADGLDTLLAEGPRDLTMVLQDSIALLDEEAAAALRRISVCEGHFDAERFAAIVGVEVPDAMLQTLVDHHLMVRESGRFRLHRALRESTRALLGEEERQDAERRWFARLLQEMHGPHKPAVVDLQAALVRGHDDPETQARLGVALAEVWRAERRAVDELERWLPACSEALSPGTHGRLLTQWAFVRHTGEPAEGLPLAERALELVTDVMARGDALYQRGLCRMNIRELDAAREDAEAILALEPSSPEGRARLAVYAMSIMRGIGDHPRMQQVIWATEELVHHADVPIQLHFHSMRFQCALRHGNHDEARRASSAQIALAEGLPLGVRMHAELDRYVTTSIGGDPVGSIAHAENLLPDVRRCGPMLSVLLRGNRLTDMLDLGWWQQAQDEAWEATACATGHVDAMAIMRVVRAELARALGRLDEAHHRWAQVDPSIFYTSLFDTAALAAQEGDLERAVGIQEERVERANATSYEAKKSRGRLAELYAFSGRFDEAEALLVPLMRGKMYALERTSFGNLLAALRGEAAEEAPYWRSRLWGLWASGRRGESTEDAMAALEALAGELPETSDIGWRLQRIRSL